MGDGVISLCTLHTASPPLGDRERRGVGRVVGGPGLTLSAQGGCYGMFDWHFHLQQAGADSAQVYSQPQIVNHKEFKLKFEPRRNETARNKYYCTKICQLYLALPWDVSSSVSCSLLSTDQLCTIWKAVFLRNNNIDKIFNLSRLNIPYFTSFSIGEPSRGCFTNCQ